MTKSIQTFKELIVWQQSMELVKLIYEISSTLPSKEKYCLNDQLRRSAISVPSNIAEGFRRQYDKEFKQFLYISRGSLAELETQLLIMSDCYSVNRELLGKILIQVDYISWMTASLLKKLSSN